MSRTEAIRRRAAAALDIVLAIEDCEDTLDQLLSVREVPLAVPSGFFRTSLSPPPFVGSLPPTPVPDFTGNRGPGELSFTVGEKIKAQRELRGMTQQDLAEATGIRRPNIARLERGSGLPNLATILKVANGLQVPLTSLMS